MQPVSAIQCGRCGIPPDATNQCMPSMVHNRNGPECFNANINKWIQTPAGSSVRFTRFVVLRASRDKKKETVAQELWHVIADSGLPRVIQTDNGTEWVNDVVNSLKNTYGAQHRLVTAYNHQANGAVERMIRTVTTMLKKQLQGANQRLAE